MLTFASRWAESADAQRIVVRLHWGVELTHQTLDVAFEEDARPWIRDNPRGLCAVLNSNTPVPTKPLPSLPAPITAGRCCNRRPKTEPAPTGRSPRRASRAPTRRFRPRPRGASKLAPHSSDQSLASPLGGRHDAATSSRIGSRTRAMRASRATRRDP